MAPGKTCRFTSMRQMLSVVLEQIIGIINKSSYPSIRRSISYNELNYKLTFAVLKELMEPDEFLLALESLDRSGGGANTAKRVARNIYVLDNLLRLVL